MAARNQGFKTLATTKYKGVQVDILEGHIHDFNGTFISFPIPTNNTIFNSRFSAKDLRARLHKFTVAQRVFEAAGDTNGAGELSKEIKKGATGALADREGTLKVTSACGLEPGVKKIIHVYHPSFLDDENPDYMPSRLELLWDTYSAIFDTAYAKENYVPGMKIAISPLCTELPDWRSPQPHGTKNALKAIAGFIRHLIGKIQIQNLEIEPPEQIAIVIPPPEGEDVRQDKRDEEFRQQLVQNFVTELPTQLVYSLAPPNENAAYLLPAFLVAPSTSNAIRGEKTEPISAAKSAAATPTGGPSTRSPLHIKAKTRRCISPIVSIPPQSPLKPLSECNASEENNDDNADDQPGDNNDDEDEEDSDCNSDPDEEEQDQFVDATPLPESIIRRIYKRVLIQLCAGDIAHFPSLNPKGPPYARIVVTDAAIEMDGNGGLDDEAIHAAAGPMLKVALTDLKDREDYVNKRASVWTTGSYNLGLIGVRRIIHAIGPLYHPRASEESNARKRIDLGETYYNALCKAVSAENNRANMMIAFSLLSTNKNNFPYDEAMRIAVETILRFLNDGEIGGINHIVFVVPRRDDDRVKTFIDAIKKVLGGEEDSGRAGERSDAPDSDPDSDDEDSNGGEGPSNANTRTTTSKKTSAQNTKRNTIKREANDKRKPKRITKKEAKDTAADAARTSAAKAQRIRTLLREAFRHRVVETPAQIAERQKIEAEESKRMKEQVKKNLDDLYKRIAEEKKREREEKHAMRAAYERVQEKAEGKPMAIMATRQSSNGSEYSEDASLTRQIRQTRQGSAGRLAKQAQGEEGVAPKKTPAKPYQAKRASTPYPEPPKQRPAAKRLSTQIFHNKKAAEGADGDSDASVKDLFLVPEQSIDAGIRTRSSTRLKRSRADIEENLAGSTQGKRLKKK
ncbi:hypothetical protein ONS95_011372 [Cadophora gregata]|uniref:uncharacterized protein n=1 Tax=Cadophora gregata TaxID=51156 RepID=UPI0026DC7DEA|nr:uncharacterized protein ONS95_011372 [Cadophora gregata]KAK0119948.1 hypothetical protein ONS95_011372 [Cadophora gregata]KAK0120983.1 hypothetical protein ONS96_011175 [Cadophora gregata f. sp. sojae]